MIRFLGAAPSLVNSRQNPILIVGPYEEENPSTSTPAPIGTPGLSPGPILYTGPNPGPVSDVPSVPASASVASDPGGTASSIVSTVASAVAAATNPAPTFISNVVDPATGIQYTGNLTPDAQTLMNAGLLVTTGNDLTVEGSALAAQGDLVTGVPAPSVTTADTATADSEATFSAWFSAETIWTGVPNGVVLGGGVVGAFLLVSLLKGKKR